MSLDLNRLNEKLLNEADGILYELGLYDSLKKYGDPKVSGSYFLNLMTWRDLDIYLKSEAMDNETFFDLGKEITMKLNPSKMSFRNELIGKTPHLPEGLYWGVHTNLFDEKWKVDIWAINSEEVKRKQREVEEIKYRLDNSKKESILELKNQLHSHPLYRKTFFSVDIYDAVLNDKVTSLEQFKEWLCKRKEIQI
ncbi:hypothetical protein GLW08_16445 [Pontibacillus yanchengensis]|uniref:Uncharacterized protein n=1 Tax=Pontibacillus yanchengensis TaxID=462910 RepID=A0ACC7VL99_9BACI|nr:hypothetical protein [Pontibacillus yanchengensis]MYL54925.1 hypothetical protein [Pontibacillus yanchengensis]